MKKNKNGGRVLAKKTFNRKTERRKMGTPTEKEFRNLHALIGVEDGIAKAIWAFEKHKEQLFETEQGSRIKYVNELLQTLRLLSAE
ncbi:hypothetical protein, partial [Sinorhizobium sp. GL28]|uniref:hypothetical protein n=1 Tax=Sinorhizobium sp. GL28 TaxID=1358418 RepID=UPI0012E33937